MLTLVATDADPPSDPTDEGGHASPPSSRPSPSYTRRPRLRPNIAIPLTTTNPIVPGSGTLVTS